jgi:virginiamycin A acetyltransferase
MKSLGYSSIIDRAYFKFCWLRWKREQMTNLALRQYFYDRFDIEVGLYSYGCFDRWRMPGPLRIGRYCSFGNSVRVVDANHPLDGLTTHPIGYDPNAGVIDHSRINPVPLVVEDDVWVGHNTVILPGCKHIGRGAVIGAGSIVTRDIAAYSIVAGNPARMLRPRFSECVIEAIEASQWWRLTPAELRAAELQDKLISAPAAEVLTALARLAPSANLP